LKKTLEILVKDFKLQKYKNFFGVFLFLASVLGFFFIKIESFYLKILFSLLWIPFFLIIFGFEKIKRNPENFITLFFLFLPFERVGSISVLNFTLRFSQIILLSSLLFIFLETLFLKNFKKIRKSLSGNLSLFIFFLFILFTPLFSNKTENLLRSLLVAFFEIFTLTLVFVIPYFFKKEKISEYTKFSNFLIIFLSLFAILQFFLDMIGVPSQFTGLQERYTKIVFGFPRPHGTLIEPLFFANFLIFPISISFANLLDKIFLEEKKRKINFLKNINFISFLLGTFSIFLSLSRGGIVAFLISVFSVFLFKFKIIFKNGFSQILKIFSISSSVLIFLIIFIEIIFGESATKFSNQLFNFVSGTSVDERNLSMDIAKELFFENPITGIGTGNFGISYAEITGISQINGFQTVNNQYLEILTENGVIGFLFFFFFIFFWLQKSFKTLFQNFYRKKEDRDFKKNLELNFLLGIFSGFFGTIFQWNTFSTLWTFWIWFWFGMMIAIIKNFEE